MSSKLFKSAAIASKYAAYRPQPPKVLIEKIMTYLKQQIPEPFGRAVDVGCGSGQSTSLLAPYFVEVIGIDVSEAQLVQARKQEKNNNITYEIGSCEKIPTSDNSVHLITASQALHWFDLPTFYKEVDRTLTPGGVLAAYCYGFPIPTDLSECEELQRHMTTLYATDTGEYWHVNRKMVDNHYKDIVMPYSDNAREDIFHRGADWSVAEMVGYAQSWSGYQTCLEKEPQRAEKALKNFEQNFMLTLKATGSPEEARFPVKWHYTLLMSRKPL